MKIFNAIKAGCHYISVLRQNGRDIAKSIKFSSIIEGFDDIDYHESPELHKTQIDILDLTVEQAVPFYTSPTTAVLNFASFKNPGGGYLTGAIAQEESICHNSSLYPVLLHFKDWYKTNKKYVNDGLYYDTALYTPYIKFGKATCNVFTIAAPNFKEWSTSKTNETVPSCVMKDKNSETLRQRIDFVLGCMKYMNQKTLILGAFGCGAFGQSPMMVASIFHEFLETKYVGVFEKVIFAIPDERNGNFKAFKYIFEKHGLYDNKKRLHKYEVPFIDPGKDTVEILHVKAIDKMEAMKAILMIIEKRGVYCDDSILDQIYEVTERTYKTVEDIIKS